MSACMPGPAIAARASKTRDTTASSVTLQMIRRRAGCARRGLRVDRHYRGDVAGAEGFTLPDRLSVLGDQRRLARIDRERVPRIVHDRAVVVVADVVAIGDVLI